MNLSEIDLLAIAAAAIGVWMCGVGGSGSLLRGLGLQTGLLGALTALHGAQTHVPQYLLLAAVVLVAKAVVIPLFLSWGAGRIGVRRERDAALSLALVMLGGCAAVVAGYFLAGQVAAETSGNPGAAGMALALLMMGMLLMLTRRLAINQVIGFLVLENGIYLFALTQTHGMPLMVEMGVVFDVLIGVMVAGLVIFRLNRSFEHIDVTQLRGLRH